MRAAPLQAASPICHPPCPIRTASGLARNPLDPVGEMANCACRLDDIR